MTKKELDELIEQKKAQTQAIEFNKTEEEFLGEFFRTIEEQSKNNRRTIIREINKLTYEKIILLALRHLKTETEEITSRFSPLFFHLKKSPQ